MNLEQGLVFSGEELRSLLRPCVYIMLKNNEVLYVGVSNCGMSRVTAKIHKQANKARQECDTLKIQPMKSIAAARELESMLINKLGPKYNAKGTGRKPISQRIRFTAPPDKKPWWYDSIAAK